MERRDGKKGRERKGKKRDGTMKNKKGGKGGKNKKVPEKLKWGLYEAENANGDARRSEENKRNRQPKMTVLENKEKKQ